MILFIIVLTILTTAALTGWLARVIDGDGLGHRPPPSAAPEWSSGSPASWSR